MERKGWLLTKESDEVQVEGYFVGEGGVRERERAGCQDGEEARLGVSGWGEMRAGMVDCGRENKVV